MICSCLFFFLFFRSCQFSKPGEESGDYPDMAKEAGKLIIKKAFSSIAVTYFNSYSQPYY